MLIVDLPWMDGVVPAKRAQRVPTVLSRAEVTTLLALLEGRSGLIASLLYGTGMRLMECLRLRVNDVDFGRCEIPIRDGKGKDRRTLLPRALVEPVQMEIQRVRVMHSVDLAAGFCEICLAHASVRNM